MKSIAKMRISKFSDVQEKDKNVSAIPRFQFFCHYFILGGSQSIKANAAPGGALPRFLYTGVPF